MNYNFKIIYSFLFCFLIHIDLNYNANNWKKFNKFENYLKNSKYIKSLRKVVYTTLFGNYDYVHLIKKEKGYDYFMFTDQHIQNNSKNNWTFLEVDKNMNFSNKKEIIKRQKYYKMNPHLFFQNYNISIYIDATFEIKGKLNEFLLRILTPNKSIYILEHIDRNTIYKEFEAVVEFKRDSLESIIPMKKKYKCLF